MSGSETFRVGLRVGKYELVHSLAEGGFGVIWVARDVNLDRELAIKFLHPHHSANPDVVRRFLQEARSLAKLVHPSIVTVYESGEVQGTGTPADGAAFIIMELLIGETLSQRLVRTGRLPPAVAMEVCRQVANALESAHAQGIVHRDLKSDNIMLVRDASLSIGERAKVLDFGIAKQATTGGQQGSTHTQAGMVFGTPNYMSPEQCRSAADANHSSDIYSLGCILFELLTGKPPFQGAMAELIAHHLLTPPPVPSIVQPGIPPHLDQVIGAMLAKRPEDRPASMTVVERILDESRLGGLPGRRRTLGGAQLNSEAPPISSQNPASPAALAAMVGAPLPASANPRLAEAAAATIAAQQSAAAVSRRQTPPPQQNAPAPQHTPMPQQAQHAPQMTPMPQPAQPPQNMHAATMAVPAAGTPPGGHAAKTIAVMDAVLPIAPSAQPGAGPNVKTMAVQVGDPSQPAITAPAVPSMPEPTRTPTTMQSAAGVAAAIDARQAKKKGGKGLLVAAGVVVIGAAIAVVAVTRGGGGGGGGETTSSEPATQPAPNDTSPAPTKNPPVDTAKKTPPPVDTKVATPPPVDTKIATPPPVDTKIATPPVDTAKTTPPPVDTAKTTPPPVDTKIATPPVDTKVVKTTPPPVDTKIVTPPPVDTKVTKTTPPPVDTKVVKTTPPPVDTKVVKTTPPVDTKITKTTPGVDTKTTKTTPPPSTTKKTDKKCQGKQCILDDGSSY